MCPMLVTEGLHNKCLNGQPCVQFIFSPRCESDMILSVMTILYKYSNLENVRETHCLLWSISKLLSLKYPHIRRTQRHIYVFELLIPTNEAGLYILLVNPSRYPKATSTKPRARRQPLSFGGGGDQLYMWQLMLETFLSLTSYTE